ncbi:hypothetical protein SORDD17_00791 [Streptococcus oralis]|uniref:2'-5' RNA ligase family protein n=1 Tax=Streptococcus oralis TaxID=1303 RepID=A0A139RMK7_STROR|nr:2'-5' RNA ligase family protein [Streptococcus oralis]KXU15971.1 hypothetical protein SORDD17_00791 [Streptococcus oralis]
MSDNGLSDYAYEVKNREPHLTLASLEKLDLATIQSIMKKLSVHYAPIKLNISSISSFLGSPIITLNPVKTLELTAFHADLHGKISNYIAPFSAYLPQYWVPHLTLANRVAEDKLASAYFHCLYHCPPISGQLTGIKLIKIGNGQVEDIYEVPLKMV